MSKTTPAQDSLQLATPDGVTTNVEKFEFEPIKGYPMLNWRGKRPFTSTQYYPAQLKEVHGEEVDGWRNKIFWGDNLQVMSHLLRQFRGKVDLIYIDPPFDSKADYKLKVQTKGKQVLGDQSSIEEKQYGDIWSNDEYLQFMYERLVLLRELLGPTGSLFLHCDWHRNHHLRCLLDEVFGANNFVNEIVWRRKGGSALGSMSRLSTATDRILWYAKSDAYLINPVFVPADQEYIDQQFRYTDPNGRRFMVNVLRSPSPRPNLMYDYKGYKTPPNGWAIPLETMRQWDAEGRLYFPDSKTKQIYKKIYLDEYKGQQINDLWADISTLKGNNSEITGYPTQKPVELLDRVLELASSVGGLVLDTFIGSGTTAVAAVKKGRRVIGADINLGAIQTTTRRLVGAAAELGQKSLGDEIRHFTGFEIHNVNHYDIFRNPIQAKELLIEALEVQKLEFSTVFDGEKDGRMVKIMPVNRIATRADLNELIAGFDYKAWERKQNESSNRPIEKITLVCMGHEPDLAAQLELAAKPFKIDVEVVDILRDKADLEFKRDSQAKVVIKNGELVIEKFYPMNLLQKLSLQKESVDDWKELVESVLIDWNYDGAVLQPAVVDIPDKGEMVKGAYKVPGDAGTIRVKITDLLSESWEGSVSNGD
ncbi:adenine-specific DNA-methyltransferase [Oryzomicrobium terrae]|uniref:site-specific DNA-methyltransferase (adenine-specific) n=1 Tax=Oryzomicrobium terrae TaxID=1735038 RepID=A0A5C1EEF0_9RHOO|nr:site-specific DNA-methyltransferase [Oryzomicrobium terrae]QEL66527.1 adenine-specific DNA-methyltransferase [Oryzomicrobium terrae]